MNGTMTTTSDGSSIGGGWLDVFGYWHPYWPETTSNGIGFQWTNFPTEPTTCMGKAHVFECDHVETCKCGKVIRILEADLVPYEEYRAKRHARTKAAKKAKR